MRRMNPLLVALFGACYLLLWNCAAFANACVDENNVVKTDGHCWRELAPAMKTAVVRGIWVGQDVQSTALNMSAETGTIWFSVDWAAVPEGTTSGDITDYFDKLYETPANRKIKWKYAYILAALAARDDDENDRLSLLTFLRSNDELPFFGTLVSVKSGNVVEIFANDKRYEVRLSGVKVPKGIEEKTKAFLVGLTGGATFADCAKSEPTPVTLYYGTELFDEEGRLTASLRIDSFYRICVKNVALQLAADGARYTNIGQFLILNGLAEVDPRLDPKWSDQRKRWLSNDYAVQQAKESGMYLYGQSTNPLVEMVSGRLPPDTY